MGKPNRQKILIIVFIIGALNLIQVCGASNSSQHSINGYPKSKKFSAALCKEQNNGNVPYTIEKYTDRIPAEVGEFPFQVALGYLNEDGSISYDCSGSLIADDIVLTVAHCVNRKAYTPVTVKLGRTSLVPDENDNGVGEDIEIQVER